MHILVHAHVHLHVHTWTWTWMCTKYVNMCFTVHVHVHLQSHRHLQVYCIYMNIIIYIHEYEHKMYKVFNISCTSTLTYLNMYKVRKRAHAHVHLHVQLENYHEPEQVRGVLPNKPSSRKRKKQLDGEPSLFFKICWHSRHLSFSNVWPAQATAERALKQLSEKMLILILPSLSSSFLGPKRCPPRPLSLY